MTLQIEGQELFSAGAFPGMERVPDVGAEDIVNGIVLDDGGLQRRGGSAYKTAVTPLGAGKDVFSLWDGYLLPGRRTVFNANPNAGGKLYALAADDTTLVDLLPTGSFAFKPARFVEVAGMLLRPRGSALGDVAFYGGDLTGTEYAAPAGITATFTQGSKIVTGGAAAFPTTANARGQLITTSNAATALAAVIDSFDSATQITLRDPWPYATVTTVAAAHRIKRTYFRDFSAGTNDPLRPGATAPVVIGQIHGRLILAQGNRLNYSAVNILNGIPYNAPMQFNTTEDFHDLPEGVVIMGVEPLGDVLYVFTTAGVWTVHGLAFEATDAFGNAQHRVQQVSRDLVLWNQAAIASFRGAIVVPAIDDVMLYDGASSEPITGGMQRLYRSYVRAGYQPGQAAVYRGHYFLPILNGSALDWVDTLVWALDREGAPAVRWDGHGGRSQAYVQRVIDTSGVPTFLGAVDERLVDLSGTLEPAAGNKNDADGVAHALKVTTRTFRLPGMVAHFWRFLRVRYELDDAATDNPTITAEVATGRPGSAFSALSGAGAEGEQRKVFEVGKDAVLIRFRVTSVSATSKFILRAIETWVRPRPGRR